MKAELSLLARCTACLVLAWVALLHAQPVAVRVPEAPARTVLALSSRDGAPLATGQLVQTVAGARVTSHLTFRFADGSIHDETTIFSQAGVFRLLSYHLTQSGPSFRWALDMTLDMETGRVVVRHTERDGTEEVEDEILRLPPDVSNGMMVSILKNLSPRPGRTTASFVAATPEPRPVKLAISAAGSEPVSLAGSGGRATHYVIKAEIGGLAGVLAPLVGKQPPDTHVWILEGDAPSFVKSEGPLFYGGPIWRIELAR